MKKKIIAILVNGELMFMSIVVLVPKDTKTYFLLDY